MLALAHPEVPEDAPNLPGVGGQELYAWVLTASQLRFKLRIASAENPPDLRARRTPSRLHPQVVDLPVVQQNVMEYGV